MKKINKIKQSFAIFLIFTLIFAMFPGAIGAEEASEINIEESTEQIDEGVNEKAEEESDSEEQTDESEAMDEEIVEEEASVTEETKADEESEDKGSEKATEDVVDDSELEKTEPEVQAEQKSRESKTLALRENNSENEREKNETNKEEHDRESVKDEAKKSMQKTKDYYRDNNPYEELTWEGTPHTGSHSDYWILSALWGAGYKDLKNDFSWNGLSPWSKDNYWTKGKTEATGNEKEDAGIIVGSVFLEMDPFNFGERNIVKDLIEKQKEDGSFTDQWGEPWVLIALDLVDVEYDQEKHIEAILGMQKDDGQFMDADGTGWMMMALAPHMSENEAVKQAVDKSIAWAHNNFIEKDEFQGEWGPNSNATSAIIMGLAAAGEDLYSEKWAKDSGSLVEQLIDYQQPDGSFWWAKDYEGNISMATDQALLAIATVVSEQSIFAKFKNPIPEPEPEPEPEPSPDPKPEPVPVPVPVPEPDEPEIPEAPENPTNPDEDKDKVVADASIEDDKKLPKEEVQVTASPKETDDKLPDTATNMYNFMVIGLLLLITGVVIVMMRKRNVIKMD